MPLKAKPFDAEDWADVIFEGNAVLNENYWFPAYTIIIGLPGEKEDDLWATARLIDRLERGLPERVGPKAHFTVTPLSFVPIGLLRDKDFYNVDERVNEAAFIVIYRAWRHTIMELVRSARDVFKTNPFFKAFMFALSVVGADIILRSIEKWGKKMGFDPEKAKRIRWDN